MMYFEIDQVVAVRKKGGWGVPDKAYLAKVTAFTHDYVWLDDGFRYGRKRLVRWGGAEYRYPWHIVMKKDPHEYIEELDRLREEYNHRQRCLGKVERVIWRRVPQEKLEAVIAILGEDDSAYT